MAAPGFLTNSPFQSATKGRKKKAPKKGAPSHATPGAAEGKGKPASQPFGKQASRLGGGKPAFASAARRKKKTVRKA
jgi:hypothetical protein